MPGKKNAKPKRRASARSRHSRRTAPVKRHRRGIARRLLTLGLIAGIWVSLALGAVLAYYAYTLPPVDSVAEISRRPSITVLASDGTILATVGEVYGRPLGVAELPAHLPQAVIAVEDRRFYEHGGVDPLGILRALFVNLREGEVVQGGSTITQQLAKNLFLKPDRTLSRKIQESMLAFWMERKFSKDQILTLYLNRVYFGAGTFGVDAAAERYFGKPASHVTLYEAAMLAGLLKAPSRYNPAGDADLADQRARVVLDIMVDAGFITPEQAAAAAVEGPSARPRAYQRARYFADWVLGQVEALASGSGSDLIVHTTLDPRIQAIAEEEAARIMSEEGEARGASQVATVVLSPEGAVLAMVGGLDYVESQFNRAVQALRQPGSAFKLFVYLAGIEAGMVPNSLVFDGPISVKGWAPGNFDDRYFGEVTLREAFARSLNSVAVQVSEQVGRDKVATAARRLGITTALEATPSIALGTSEVTLLELAGAFATFDNGGRRVLPYGIADIRTPVGGVVFERGAADGERAVMPATVAAMNELMRASVAWGTAKGAEPGRPAAGKTGTSQDFRDAWFLGYTAELVVGVWVGNDDGTPMKRVTGGSLPARIWRAIVTRSLEGEPAAPLPGGNELLLAGPAGKEAPEGGGDGLISRILRGLTGEGETGPENKGNPDFEPYQVDR